MSNLKGQLLFVFSSHPPQKKNPLTSEKIFSKAHLKIQLPKIQT